MTTHKIAEALSHQAKASDMLGSPFTSVLLNKAAENFSAQGIVHNILHDWPDEPVASALALRFAGALNWLRLTDRAPELTPLYPPHWQGDDGVWWREIETVVQEHAEDIRAFIRKPIQTNEIGRSAPLLLGFLDVAKRFGLVLRMFELGASGGLNLYWDRFRYEMGNATWGDTQTQVLLSPKWKGADPVLDVTPTVISRAGCDISPVDYADDRQARRTLAFIWPDQPERVARFTSAVGLFRNDPVTIEKADAADWLERVVTAPVEGAATIVYHSVVWQYFSEHTQVRISRLMEDVGARATERSPLAWVRLEPEDPKAIPDVRVTLWPSGETQRLAWAHPHGTSIEYGPVSL